MVKFTIIFYRPPEVRLADFEPVYVAFLALVEQIPNIQRRQVVDVVGSPEGRTRFYRFLELYFEDRETMNAALNTEAGQAAGAALFEIVEPQGFRFETLFADVYEDEGGSNLLPTEDDTPDTEESSSIEEQDS